MKCLAQDINKFCEKKRMRQVYKYYLPSVFSKQSLEEIDKWFSVLLAASLSKAELSKDILLALEGTLTDNIALTANNGEDAVSIEDVGNHIVTLYEKSRYYQHFYQKHKEHFKNANTAAGPLTNDFYCSQLVSALLKYLPFLPLFTQIDGFTSPPRFSNVPVENWFGLIKTNITGSSPRFQIFYTSSKFGFEHC